MSRRLQIIYFSLFFSTMNIALATNFLNDTDMHALVFIRDGIQSDPNGIFSSWNNSLHFCNWPGVTCNSRNQRLSALNLSGKELRGTVSPYIGSLSFLKELNLESNFLYGSIPQEIGRLYQLQHISLQNNSFQGEIPKNLGHCSELKVINLNRNKLQGKIPSELSSLSKLQELHVSLNSLNGTIPPSLGNLSALRILSLSDNNLEGSIPAEFGSLFNLELLKLSSNKLSGSLPSQLFNMSSIQHFMLTFNLLNGSFPWDLGLLLPKLQTFSVAGNQFSGPIPSSITNASGLVVLDIGMNSLLGPIPMNMGKLRQLQRLVLSSNPLGKDVSGGLDFLFSLANCTNLTILHVNDNSHKGILPSSIGNLSTKLTSLKLDGNYISGGIPEELGNLINLNNLGLSQNMLTGVIPEFVGNLTKLQGLYLSRNNFTGGIPSIGEITMLTILEMQENMLGGVIPVSLGNCRRLLKLDLSHNRLTGEIPVQLLALTSLTLGLNLSNNQLSGPLPSDVGNLINLVSLDVSNNNLSEELPYTLGSCVVLKLLNVQGNHFDGSIPKSLRGLRSIQFLDLSSNYFSGPFPVSLANISFLQYINLSFNLLEGEVPNIGLFRNSTAFSITGNKKLCGGMKSLKLPECHMEKPPREMPSGGSDISFHIVAALLTSGYLCFSLLVHTCLLRYCTRERRSPTSEVPAEVSPMGDHYPKLSYTELCQATNGFSPTSLIAMGRYSSVYQGILKYSEQAVAVKVLNLKEKGSRKSFVAECEALKNIRHRNLVKIITSCSGEDFRGNEFKALVYELMPNECLESWLHPNSNSLQELKNLDLIQRLNIAIDVASVLNYLHHGCEVPIIHRDVKPSNILLDDELCAHLGDFGSARSLSHPIDRTRHRRNLSNDIGIVGTIGYVALEFATGGPVSTLVDVYSYGIVLLEMFSGKRPTDDMFIDDFCLHNYVKMAIPDEVLKVTDPRLLSEGANVIHETAGQARQYTSHKMERCLALIFRMGVTCSAYLPSERMEISDALMGLCAIRDILLGANDTSILVQG